jgi:hypothetical protein
MATVTYTRRAVCAGGCHVTFDVAFNGGVAQRVVFDVDDLRRPFSSFTEEQLDLVRMLVLKAHVAGGTRPQAAAAFPINTPVEITL